MKKRLVTAVGALVFTTFLEATPIPIFNTGLNSSSVALAGGSVDPHYTLITSADANGPGPNAFVGSPIPGAWIADNATSEWLSPNTAGTMNLNPGLYVYMTSFTLPTGFTLASLTGQWATDNNATMQLNGNTVAGPTTDVSFLSFTPFLISSGFVTGTNTLTFLVNNVSAAANPTGLRVEISGTFTPAEAIPEPATPAVVGAGIIALLVLRKRCQTPTASR